MSESSTQQAGHEAWVGWYSEQHAAMSGTAWWVAATGEEVEVTSVSKVSYEGYAWPDAVCLGEVVRYARDGARA